MSESGARERKEGQILTRRLKLTPLRERDVGVLARIASSEAVRHNLTVVLDPMAPSPEGEAFMAERRRERIAIGAGGYRTVGDGAAAEFALWIGEPAWGCGYGTEIAQALIDRAFGHPQVMEVRAAVRVTNGRGRRLVEKCGFQLRSTGMARAAHGAFPAERFVLTRGAWISLKAWGAHFDEVDHRERRRATA
jgi:RimJ/RimL family protein N-acetyltransferase